MVSLYHYDRNQYVANKSNITTDSRDKKRNEEIIEEPLFTEAASC
jgi:hypothetical protein